MDLGTLLAEQEEAARRGGGGGKQRRRGEAEAGGLQIRPKRRLPVSKVLLVGGATRMPAVRTFVRNMTGIDAAEFVVDPDLVRGGGARPLPISGTAGLLLVPALVVGSPAPPPPPLHARALIPSLPTPPPRPLARQAVALGAAVQAGIYEGQVSDLMVIDVWQASLMRAFAGQLERERAALAGEQLQPGSGEEGEEGEEEGGEEEGGEEGGGGAGGDDRGEGGWGEMDLEEAAAAAAAAAEQGEAWAEGGPP